MECQETSCLYQSHYRAERGQQNMPESKIISECAQFAFVN